MSINNHGGDLARSQSVIEVGDSDSRSVGKKHKPRCMSTEAMQTLYDLRQNNLLCDAILVLANGERFPVHKAILAACSDFLRTMFTTALPTKNDKEYSLPSVTTSMMKISLDYAYLRTLDINDDNVCKLLKTSDYLIISGIRKLCCDYLKQSLVPENCIGITKFAKEMFCEDLERDARDYTLRYFEQVAERSQELWTLSNDELADLLSRNELNIKSEETAWTVVIKWIDHDVAKRKVHVKQLLNSIRLGLLNAQFFLENIKDHPYVVGNENCRPIVIETLKFLYDLEIIDQKESAVATPRLARPRLPREILFAIGGWCNNSATNFMETYDTRADRWIKVREVDPSGPRGYHGTAVIGHNIYVIGGFNGSAYFNSCRCFNVVTKSWREIAPMNIKRSYVSVTVLNDIIYALGGFDGYCRQKTAERYDHKKNQWTLIAPMNAARSDASATTLNGLIYIIGGFNGRECMSTAEVYDPKVNMWTMLPSMRSRRSGVSCIAYHNKIYAIGGFNGLLRMSSGERYDPETYSWTRIPDMYMPRSNFAIEIIDDMIFAIGGFNGRAVTFYVECFDDTTNEWYEATDMNRNRSGLSACVVESLPNVRDYIHKHRERLMEEKRQKILALKRLENQRQQYNNQSVAGQRNQPQTASRNDNGSENTNYLIVNFEHDQQR